MTHNSTKEPQYQFLVDLEKNEGMQRLGLMSSQVWRDDPRRLGFVLARYKFVAKMLAGLRRVLEVGCADAFGTRVVRQEVPCVVATDFDPVFIDRNKATNEAKWPVEFRVHDMIAEPLAEGFDGCYSVDVLEHIPREQENFFLGNMAASLHEHGVCIIGSPSLESQPYASPPSKAGHVNCKSGPEMREVMSRFFHNVFLFSMNDEVVHTGYHAMAHYLFAVCCGVKKS
jgi:2-polyprenyl-3-methyl-5-hydroxy-6-metoxy-1,4-benzoquinol methylase